MSATFLEYCWPVAPAPFEQVPDFYGDGWDVPCRCALELAVIPPNIYYEASLFNVSQEKKGEAHITNCSSKILFAVKGFFAPVRTQRERNRQANEMFGKFRCAHGFKENGIKLFATALLQTLALINYSWTVLTCVITIPLYAISTIALMTIHQLANSCCSSLENEERKVGKLEHAAYMSMFTLLGHVHGVPRAAAGIVQKIATLCFLPVYAAGKTIQHCVSKDRNEEV